MDGQSPDGQSPDGKVPGDSLKDGQTPDGQGPDQNISTPTMKGQPGFAEAVLYGCCPECGARTLFAGLVRFADQCPKCGLDYTRFNVGDGPAALLTLIVGGMLTVLALWLELSYSPPFWVHVLLWIPATIAAGIIGLRLAKAALLFAEYRNQAGEAGAKDL